MSNDKPDNPFDDEDPFAKNPFDDDKTSDNDKTSQTEKKAKPFNPFDLPPLPPRESRPPQNESQSDRFGASRFGSSPFSTNPFDNPFRRQSPKAKIERLRSQLADIQEGKTQAKLQSDIAEIKSQVKEKETEYHEKLAEFEAQKAEQQGLDKFKSIHLLAFRHALETDSNLVDYIENNLDWLRLVGMIYGGISDNGLATYRLQYEEIATTLQMADSPRAFQIDELRKESWWRDSWEGDDVVYNLAVYLDVECGKLATRASKTVPQFSPYFIVNDSPLTPILLEAIRTKKPVDKLISRLWREWERSQNPLTRAHALIALLLSDTSKAIDVFRQTLANPQHKTTLDLMINHLQMRAKTLNGAVFLLGSQGRIGHVLNPLYDSLEGQQWVDLVERFYQTFTTVLSFPANHDDILLSRRHEFPRIAAEIWAYWLSGYNHMSVEDAVYNLAVILDKVDNELASAPALVNMHLAYNHKFDKNTKWDIEQIPPVFTETPDIVGEALTIAQSSEPSNLEKLFHVATIRYISQNRGDVYTEYPELKVDALAATVATDISWENMKVTLDELADDSLTNAGLNEAVFYILQNVVRIKNHTIRSRALWRIAQLFWRRFDLWEMAIEAARQIQEPLQQSRAYERILDFVPRQISIHLQKLAEEAAYAIPDMNNKARALTRLALRHDDQVQLDLLTAAVDALSQVTDTRAQIETLLLMQPYLRNHVTLLERTEEILSGIDDSWLQIKARDLLSVLLLQLHDSMADAKIITPAILYTLIDDVLHIHSDETKIDDIWQQLLQEDKRESAKLELLKIASQNELHGLAFTKTVYKVLNSLIEEHEQDIAYSLMPYLHTTDTALLPLLREWVKQRPDREVWRHAGLILAANGQLDEETLPCVLELLAEGVDLDHYHASLVLHSNLVFAGNPDRKYRTSQLGLDVVMMLGRSLNMVWDVDLFQESVLSWCWYNILHDDPEILKALVATAEGSGEDSDGARLLLRRIDFLFPDMKTVFIEALAGASPAVAVPMFKAWTSMYTNNQAHEVREPGEYPELADILHKVTTTDDMLRQFRVIPNRALTIASIIMEVAQEIDNDFENALTLLDERLDKACINIDNNTFKEVGEYMFYRFRRDPNQAIEAAQSIAESEASMNLLFMWLQQAFLQREIERNTYFYRLDTLMFIAAEAAILAPATVFNLISKYDLVDEIVNAARNSSWFWGRASAIRLLGYVRKLPDNFSSIILHSLRDVAEVQQATMFMLNNLRYASTQIIPEMIEFLRSEDASVAYAAIQVLTIIGRHEKTAPTSRDQILQALSNVVRQPNAVRGVFLYEAIEESFYIRANGTINQAAYKAIMDIINMI